ncbi:MAG: FAD binding domain-containing protein [Pseudonocardiaceae bacterium]
MDLHTITAVRRPGTRSELALGPGTAVLAGGTRLFSEPQLDLHTLVDLSGLGWSPLKVTGAGLAIAATCTLRRLAAFRGPGEWSALPLLHQCCAALAGSFKIWHEATVGGNICLGLPAGPMIALTVALDGVAVVWPAGGGERRMAVAKLVTGVPAHGAKPRRRVARRRDPGKRTAGPHRLPANCAVAAGPLGCVGDRAARRG